MRLTVESLSAMEKRFRTRLINSLSGPRVIHLIGTANADGVTNLAIFSSIFHIGADPALLGMISRPDSVDRHTLANIRKSGVYTINLITEAITEKAHQTSARYSSEISEFEAVGLTPQFLDDFTAPFVLESPLKMAMRCKEEVHIPINNTHMIIGEITDIYVDEEKIDNEGRIDIFAMNPAVCVGLDTYGTATYKTKLPYAKP